MSSSNTTGVHERFLGTGVVTVLMTLIGWSSVPLFIKHFSHVIDPWTSNGWRYTFSALLWAPVLVWGAMRKSLPPGLWKAALVPAAFNILGQVCFTKAHYLINPGLLTFSLRFQIIFVAVGAAMMFPSERRVIRSKGFVIGVCMVLGGTMALVALGENPLHGASGLGIGIALAAGLFFASYALSVRKFMHGMPPLVAFSAISQYTAAAMLGLMFVLGDDYGVHVLDMSGRQISLLLFSSFIGIALGHVCYYTAIARLGVAVSSGIIQLQPFLVSAASYFLFHEVLSLPQWAAGMVAISGAATILVVQHRMKKSEHTTRVQAPDLEGITAADAAEFADLPMDQMTAAVAASGDEAVGAEHSRNRI